MGIIQQESLRQSLVNYAGVVIGMFNVLYVYPLTLTAEQLGTYQFFISTASLLLPFALLGASGTSLKFFPEYKDEKNAHGGLLFFLILLTTFGLLVVTLILCFFQEQLTEYYYKTSPLFTRYFGVFLSMFVPFVYISLFTSHLGNFQRIAIPSIFNNLYIKIGMGISCWLYYKGFYGFDGVMNALVVIHILALLSLIFYLWYLNEWLWKPNRRIFKTSNIKPIMHYAAYSSMMGVSSYIAFFIDVFMVGTLQGSKATAIFSIAAIMANVIDTPRRAVYSVSQSIISSAWARGELEHIHTLYKKSSLNLLIITLLFYIGITATATDLFRLMPNGAQYADGVVIIFILGAARVFDALTGINDHLITLTKHYRFGFYGVLLLAILNIVLNLMLIPEMGHRGAAWATFISIVFYNIVKIFYIYKKMGILPFSRKMLPILSIGFFVLFFVNQLPNSPYPLLDIILKTILICILYLLPIIRFQFSKDFNDFLFQQLAKYQKYIKI